MGRAEVGVQSKKENENSSEERGGRPMEICPKFCCHKYPMDFSHVCVYVCAYFSFSTISDTYLRVLPKVCAKGRDKFILTEKKN